MYIFCSFRFVVQLSGLTQLWEGQSAHVEGRIEPYPDPTMKVEWFHNGQPLSVGHRFRYFKFYLFRILTYEFFLFYENTNNKFFN